ncbi:MAG: hypothetical protein KDD62_12285, partial [Bdellovibrionales bacterium]|nr:hypothetical protein [Bdellovibrionales bacterium]
MDFDDLFSSISEQTETNEESNADPSSATFTFKNEHLAKNPFHVAGINIATLQELGAKEGFELPAAVVDLLKTSLRFTVLRSHPDVFNTSDSSATEVGDFLKALNTLHKPEEMKAALTDYLQDSHIDPQLAAFYREATADLERYERQKARSAIATLEHFDFMTQLQRDGARPYQVIPANVQSPIFSKTLKKFGKILDRRENHIMNSQDQDVVDLDRLAGQVFPQVITELLAVPASPIPVTKKGTYVSNNPKLLDACWKAVARLEETLERSFLTKARDKDIAADLIVRQALATTTQALDTVHERLAHSYFRPLAMLFKTATYKTEPAIADLELLL